MLEKMSNFFDDRIDGYEEHMLNCIECADEFYAFTANELPKAENVKVLDLGCGTGVLCEILREHGIRAAGMDFSAGMIRKESIVFVIECPPDPSSFPIRYGDGCPG